MPDRFQLIEDKGPKTEWKYADVKASVLFEWPEMQCSMVCEIQFLMDWMTEAKKMTHRIYETTRMQEFVFSVSKLAARYDEYKCEIYAIANRGDTNGFLSYLVGHPKEKWLVKREESSILHTICEFGDLKMLKACLPRITCKGAKFAINSEECNDGKGRTCLMLAARGGNLKIVEYLMNACAEKDMHAYLLKKDTNNYTALAYAVMHGKVEVIQSIFETIGNNRTELLGLVKDRPLVFLAVKHRQKKSLKCLFRQKEPCVDMIPNYEEGDERYAYTGFHQGIVQGYTTVHEAIVQGNAELLEIIVEELRKRYKGDFKKIHGYLSRKATILNLCEEEEVVEYGPLDLCKYLEHEDRFTKLVEAYCTC